MIKEVLHRAPVPLNSVEFNAIYRYRDRCSTEGGHPRYELGQAVCAWPFITSIHFIYIPSIF